MTESQVETLLLAFLKALAEEEGDLRAEFDARTSAAAQESGE